MRDLAILVIVAGLAGAAFYRPWLGVLGLAVIGYLQPHTYAVGLVRGFPAYAVLFGCCVASSAIAIARRRMPMPRIPFDWRLVVLAALWGWFVLTTFEAKVSWAAWPKLAEVSKVFVSLALTLVLIDTRRKLLLLLITIAASIALVTVKGGYWAALHGFSDRVYGPPGSHFYDNNHFAVLVLMNIPLLLLWWREVEDRRLRWVLGVVIALSVGSALSSWSRGGLIAFTVTALALLWYLPRRWLGLGAFAAIAGLGYALLPDKWMDRMDTIASYGQQGSAIGRMRVWRSGVEYALDHPWLGAGFDGWRFVNVNAGNIDWHNAYVEILAEHGFPGFALWLALLAGTVVSLARLASGTGRAAVPVSARRQAALLLVSLLAYAAGAMFVGISYWDIWFQLAVVAVLHERLAREDAVGG